MKLPRNMEKSSPNRALSMIQRRSIERRREEALTGIAHRKRSRKIIKQTMSNPPMIYHLHFRQMIFLNVLNGDENHRNDVSGRL